MQRLFWFELDQVQTRKLKSMFLSSPVDMSGAHLDQPDVQWVCPNTNSLVIGNAKTSNKQKTWSSLFKYSTTCQTTKKHGDLGARTPESNFPHSYHSNLECYSLSVRPWLEGEILNYEALPEDSATWTYEGVQVEIRDSTPGRSRAALVWSFAAAAPPYMVVPSQSMAAQQGDFFSSSPWGTKGKRKKPFDLSTVAVDCAGSPPPCSSPSPEYDRLRSAAVRPSTHAQTSPDRPLALLPPSKVYFYEQKPNSSRVLFKDQDGTDFNDETANPTTSGTKQAKFHYQPMLAGSAFDEAVASGLFPNRLPPNNPRIDSLNDRTFEPFKTRSCRFERQLSNLHGKPQEIGEEVNKEQNVEADTLPVHRYFDALEGPELDTLRASEEILLPEDQQWPFLLRFPINSFGICLGVGSQAILWKNLATSPSTKFLHVSLDINLVLWCIAVALVSVVFLTYMLKVVFYFKAVRREYYHPIRVNYFFAPWIAFLFLVLGVPPSIAQNIHTALWYILMTPIFCLELKIYGEWMSGGQRRLSKVANPSTHVSIAGNFVGALLGASMGLKEGPIFFFAVGLVHYAVLFVILYQRLPTNETLPKELHPVFFLFVASPCIVSVAWARIQGSFDYGARIAYFISLFLYFSLVVRFNFFRGFRFSLAWWAYTFPTTAAAIATIEYSIEVPNAVTKSLSVLLSAISTVVDISVLVMSILHAFVLHDLFPNDIAIAISDQRPKAQPHEWFHRRTGSSNKDIENFLKFTSSNGMDIEASMMPPTTIPTGFDNSGTIEVLCHVSH